jgi:putative RNA 2'-phosphotransferase
MIPKELTKKSRHLSKVLRHDPKSAGVVLDPAGWVGVEELLKAVRLSFADLIEVVTTNDKKRFEFNEDRTRIRASQGHSVEVELGYEPAEPPEILYHGTSLDSFESIVREGILKMDRHAVHMSVDKDKALEFAARRRPSPGVLMIQAKRMAEAGHLFTVSTNGVWLTNTVPPQYILLT